MRNYDYNKLLDARTFEYFAKDLIEIREDKEFEIFSEGKDKGIDLRNIEKGFITIVQVKRNKNFGILWNELKNELKKVKKLGPDRYILITSSPISVENEEKIIDLFKGCNLEEKDIIGCEKLNGMLEKPEYKRVEDEYYQLWINSTRTLENFIKKSLNADTYAFTNNELDNIKQSAEIYVRHDKFKEALGIIKEKRCLLICGEPELGKSTLARNLCAYLMNQNKELEFIVDTKLSTIVKLFDDHPQLFFVDDFWGSWKKDKNGNSTSTRQLRQTIEMIEEDESKILIITSREYIFRQFEEENYGEKKLFENASICMKITEYTDLQKAKILFKQIENTSWEWNDIYQITEKYQEITEHVNYNPRIIEMAIDQIERTKELRYDEIYDELFMAIDEPEEFLNTIFYGQKEGAQIICILLLLFSGEIKLETLRRIFCDYIDEEGKTENSKKEHFKDYIKQLENTMIETYRKDDDGEVISIFKNATIEESVQKYLAENIYAYSKNLIKITEYLNPLLALCNVWNDDNKYEIYRERLDLEKELQEQIIEKIITEFEKLELYHIEKYVGDPVDNLPKQGVEKLIAIIKMSREVGNEKLNQWIVSKANELWNSLEDNHITYYEKSHFSDLLKELQKSELALPITQKDILESFYNRINFASEYITFHEIGKLYKEEYEKLMQTYGIDIKEKIKTQIEKDEQYFKEHKCYMEQDYLYIEVIDELHRIYDSESYFEEEKIEAREKDYEDYRNYDENKDIQKEIEKLLGLEFKKLEEKEQINYISSLDVDLEDKKMLLESIDKWYISPFFHARESIDGIIEFLLTRKELSVGNFIAELLLERLNKVKLDSSILGSISILAYDGLRYGDLLFKKEFAYSYGIDEEKLQKLIKAKIFYSVGNWIRFDNLEVLIYLGLMVVNLKNDDLEEAICGIQRVCERSGYNIGNTIFKLCEEINKYRFYEEIVEPSIKYFISKVDKKDEITIAKSIIKLLYIEICKETEENVQYISTIGLADDILRLGLLELIVVYIADDIMKELIKIEVEQFEHYRENETKVKLYEHIEDEGFIDILKKTGIISLLNKMYKVLILELNKS